MFVPKKTSVCSRLAGIAVLAVALLSLCFLLPLSVHAFAGTAYMPPDTEHVSFGYDNVLVNLLWLVASLAAAFGLFLLSRKMPYWGWFGTVMGILLLFGAWYLASAGSVPSFDSHYVTQAARNAALGDYSTLGEGAAMEGDYFIFYPFQLGYVLFCELFIRLFFASEWYVGLLAGINLVTLLMGEAAMTDTVRRLYGEDAARVTLLLFLFCLQPLCFCTFLYGNVPAFAFSAAGIWATVRYLKEGKIRYAVIGGAALALGVVLKMNCLIVLCAVLLMVAVHALLHRRPSVLIYAAAALCFTLLLRWFVVAQYEWRTGLSFGSGIPMSCWLSMGLCESSMGPGWYTGKWTVTTFRNSGYDAAAASASAWENIGARVETFAQDPAYCNEFFTKKLLSQWNETSYQSLWNTTIRPHAYERNSLAAWMCGDGEAFCKGWFDVFMQLVIPAAAGYCVLLAARMREDTEGAILPLTVFGGMLYHLLFEAKSQYALTYLLFLVPMAAVACSRLFAFAERKIASIRGM